MLIGPTVFYGNLFVGINDVSKCEDVPQQLLQHFAQHQV
jgi:hypothetical protein